MKVGELLEQLNDYQFLNKRCSKEWV